MQYAAHEQLPLTTDGKLKDSLKFTAVERRNKYAGGSIFNKDLRNVSYIQLKYKCDESILKYITILKKRDIQTKTKQTETTRTHDKVKLSMVHCVNVWVK